MIIDYVDSKYLFKIKESLVEPVVLTSWSVLWRFRNDQIFKSSKKKKEHIYQKLEKTIIVQPTKSRFLDSES